MVPTGERGTRDEKERAVTKTGTGAGTITRTSTGMTKGAGMEARTGAGMGTIKYIRVDGRGILRTFQVVIEMGQRCERGATPKSNQQPQPQIPAPQRVYHAEMGSTRHSELK